MKKHSKLASTLALVGAMALPGAASAATFLNNWYLDLDLDGDKVLVSEYLDFVGNSYIQLTPTTAPNFDFADDGFFQVSGSDGGAIGSHNDDGSGSKFATEMTAMFTDGTGTGVFGGAISFETGTLELFSDALVDYGSATGIFGADNGNSMGVFELADGSGIVDPSGVPNGELTLTFLATSLTAGYWFAPDGVTDLSTLVADGLLFGFVTTNASYVANPSFLLVSELEQLTGVVPLVNDPDEGAFVVSNNGQYRLSVVPEPGVIALLGMGLLGMGVANRRRTKA